MDFVPGFHNWLKEAGYEYHCFVSWPHIADPYTIECARRFRSDIEASLGQVIPEPKVFLSTEDIEAGDLWERVLRRSLCRSIAMVAICAPIYYDPSHPWCGLEWAAMDRLARCRIPNESFGAIIPVLIRRLDPLPSAVRAAQFHDISKGRNLGNSYFRTKEYRAMIDQIVHRIVRIASAVRQNQAHPDCENFLIPTESAFADYHVAPQPAPFRSVGVQRLHS